MYCRSKSNPSTKKRPPLTNVRPETKTDCLGGEDLLKRPSSRKVCGDTKIFSKRGSQKGPSSTEIRRDA